MAALAEFRTEVREWLEQNCPEEMRRPIESADEHVWGGRRWQFASDAQRLWMERMVEKRWTAPQWPTEYGGGGLSSDEADVLREEMRRINARSPVSNFGFWMLGPALLKFGSEEQKRTHLPAITRGEIRWCQGYSEPNAGSDLASLATRAEDEGDHFLVNGRKIWTSYADRADAMFCLVRTDPDAKKQAGISFLLFDMDSEGVSTRPIQLISGESPFCETFFEDMKVPKENLVGELNQGWTIAKYLLTHERENIGGEPPGLLKGHSLGPVAAEQIGRDER
jgi:acyl-CoA dehydrogenase